MVADSTAQLGGASSSSAKTAGVAMDKMVGAAIAKGNALKETLAAGNPSVAAEVDAVLGKFVARANELRGQLNSHQLAAGKVLDEVSSDPAQKVCLNWSVVVRELS